MSATLLVLAAGLGTRFGGGIKQLTPVGKNGELLMEFSVMDAVDAGFDKVIFIIRRDIEEDFKELIGNKIEKKVKTEYYFQDMDVLPGGFTSPEGRIKPWGTVHAVLAAKEHLNEPYLIINADDYYGKSTYKAAYEYLTAKGRKPEEQCMCGFVLGNTLSENTSVTRGVCTQNTNNKLVSVCETYRIKRENSVVMGDVNGERTAVDENSLVSMNMWGFTPYINGLMEECFAGFLKRAQENGTIVTAEYPLPFAVDELIKSGKISVEVVPTHERWFGMTIKEDTQDVIRELQKLRE
ncbi:MAG: NTP transferase domain-containing protein [Oscillospiraceae bacterium]|nr:NTP transferase domain-containing protein [Oscillospiraceae bacterium]